MHSTKTVLDQKDDETALNSYCFLFENGIKFGAIFCLRVLNFVNFLKSEKSRNLILAKIRKNKVVTLSRCLCSVVISADVFYPYISVFVIYLLSSSVQHFPRN